MTIRFSESLEAFAEAARAAGVPMDADTVIIRDGSGRLILAREEIDGARQVEKMLRERVGAYVGAIAVITGSPAVALRNDPSVRSFEASFEDVSYEFRFADRRIVGMDWLTPPAPPPNGPIRLVFGSLKGGVGRSTALAVLAADLARHGKRVLAIDLDLEAPGIGTMLLPASEDPANERRPLYGVVDYLIENGIGGIEDEELYDFIGVSTFHEGSIEVMPAVGRAIDNNPKDMIAMLSRALVEDRHDERTISVTQQIKSMVDRFVSAGEYDAVLIDARAGMAEITAAPLLGLGAELLLFGIDQPQTFRGYAYILAHMMDTADFTNNEWRQRVSFVQAKASSAPSKRQPFRRKLYDLCAASLYDRESLDKEGQVIVAEFAPGPEQTGSGVPHDALHIQFHPEYEAFDPIEDRSQLDTEVYQGPFGSFLERCWELLELDRRDGN